MSKIEVHMDKGLVHVYYGNGKGKTSSAIGLAVRSAGASFKVLFARFLKDESSSELSVLRQVKNITLCDCPKELPFYFTMTEEQKANYNKVARDLLNDVTANLGNYDVVIMDEFIDVVALGIFTIKELVDFIKAKPTNVELVITGHSLPEELVEYADYISHIVAQKHPYDNGVVARKGIEF